MQPTALFLTVFLFPFLLLILLIVLTLFYTITFVFLWSFHLFVRFLFVCLSTYLCVSVCLLICLSDWTRSPQRRAADRRDGARVRQQLPAVLRAVQAHGPAAGGARARRY